MLFGRASGLAFKGKYKEAKRAIDRCFALGMEEQEILGHAIKGEIECELGNLSEAEKSIKIVLDDVTQNPNSWNTSHGLQILERVEYFWQKIQSEKT